MHRLLALSLALLPGCWLTPAEAEQKILQDPDPSDDEPDETGDTGLDEEAAAS